MHAAAGIKGRYRIFLFVETAAAASQRGKLYQETISKSISFVENKKCAVENDFSLNLNIAQPLQ